MKDRLKALDKKTIAAIVATCILIIIASKVTCEGI